MEMVQMIIALRLRWRLLQKVGHCVVSRVFGCSLIPLQVDCPFNCVLLGARSWGILRGLEHDTAMRGLEMLLCSGGTSNRIGQEDDRLSQGSRRTEIACFLRVFCLFVLIWQAERASCHMVARDSVT